MTTLKAAQEAVMSEMSKYEGMFSIGISSDQKGHYIVVSFEAFPTDMSFLPTSVGGYRVMYKKLEPVVQQ